mgnify:CR=1 FL=1|jgi:hypothetical protein
MRRTQVELHDQNEQLNRDLDLYRRNYDILST